MEPKRFIVGQAYYEFGHCSSQAAPWRTKSGSLLFISTSIFQGIFKMPQNTVSCDKPFHFLVFQPFVAFENALERPPEHGLKFPSQREAEITMLTFDEVVAALKEEQRQLRE